MTKLLTVRKSTNPDKKYMAIFLMPNGREKTTHFGATGYSDYRQHQSEERKENYLSRHRSREDWNDPTTAGSLSKHLLWSYPTLEEAIKKFKQKFNL